jgi:hypothetical protein
MSDGVFDMPEHLPDIWEASLPAATCLPCGATIPRRQHRVVIRASWHKASETLCPKCWQTICQWAARFAYQQGILPI